MKNFDFKVVALPTSVADEARRRALAGASDHRMITIKDSEAAPCRHCLRWAEPGERVVLFPYTAIPAGYPYSETGPIFVHADRCERYAGTREYPDAFREGRAFRAYDEAYNMIDAVIANGTAPESVIEKLLQIPKIKFVDVRSVTRGCYTFRIERA